MTSQVLADNQKSMIDVGVGLYLLKYHGDSFLFAATSEKSAIERFRLWNEQEFDPVDISELQKVEVIRIDPSTPYTITIAEHQISLYPHIWYELWDALSNDFGIIGSSLFDGD